MKRHLLTLFSVLLMFACLLSACTSDSQDLVSDSTEAPETVELTILGTSDIHGYFMPWEYASDTAYEYGSLASLATLIKEVRAERENVILVDCGDTIQDNYNELFKDSEHNPLIEGMNALNYDVWVMGNHEYNFTPDILNKWISQFQGTSLSGIVYYKSGENAGTQYLPSTTVIERGGVRIGIVGLTTPMIEAFEATSGTLDSYEIHDGISETGKALAELEGKTDIIIGVMHMGMKDENGIEGTGMESILKAYPQFDAVICGHFHQTVDNELVEGVPITEPGMWASHLSRVDLVLKKTDSGWDIVEKDLYTLSTEGVADDEETIDLLTPYHEQLRAWVNEPIGRVVGDQNMIPPDDIQGIATVQTQPTA